ncbi:MAG: acyltransferase domain-containing protein, partial [Polyangiaceae bacterium]
MVGIGCRFPGEVRCPETFWRLLHGGVDAVGARPRERWEDFDVPDLPSLARGGFLRDVYGFDEAFFGISPREAREMDPQQRLMLELSWEAIEDAAMSPRDLANEPVGVFFGCMWQDYAYHAAAVPDALALHSAVGLDTSVIAARVSYRLGLRGPSLTVNTGCSSALVSVHLACQSLRSGESRMALAGGVNLLLAPHSAVAMARFGGLSPDGSCKSFDARANGYVRGEGGGVIVLKRLRDAIASGDPIYCVLRASAVNNDGASNGITAPCPRAQTELLREAYTRAGIAPHRVHYVEAHGTGTSLGDLVEATALGNALGSGRGDGAPLSVGSVKTNIGHTEAAAGIAGLIKVAIAMRKRTLPASLHFETPCTDLASLGLRVQTQCAPWPSADETPTAGVSSFGFGGTNAHVVMQGVRESAFELLPVSGDSPEELMSRIERLDSALEAVQTDEELAAVSAVASRHWSRDAFRAAAIVMPGGAAGPLRRAASLLARNATRKPRLAFVFAGSSASQASVVESLFASERVFRETIVECDELVLAESGASVIDAIGSRDERVERSFAHALPLSLAVSIGIARLLRAWGIEPDRVFGSGIGRIAAAYHAGILSMPDAVAIVAHAAQRLDRVEQRMAFSTNSAPRSSARTEALIERALAPSLAAISSRTGRVPLFSLTDPAWREATDSDVMTVEIPSARQQREDSRETAEHLGNVCFLSATLNDADGRRTLLEVVAALYTAGFDPHWNAIARRPLSLTHVPEGARVHLPLTSSAEIDRCGSTWTLPLSAHGPEALRDEANNFARHLTDHGELDLGDVLQKAARIRTRESHRLTMTAASRGALVEGLEAFARGDHFPGLVASSAENDRGEEQTPIVFLFSGHGSQWLGMCRELLAREPDFRDTLDAVETALAAEGVPSVRSHLESAAETQPWRADDVQPLLFAVQVSLAALWRSWGVEPSLIVGHSVGEVAAAHVAGCLDLPTAARVIAERARAIRPALGNGGMAVVELGRADAEALVEPYRGRVAVAVHQSPRFSVISGEAALLADITRELTAKDVFCRSVDVDYASHGPQMIPLSESLEQRLAGITCHPPSIDMISTAWGRRIEGAVCNERYWAENLRNPVQLHSAVSQALATGARTFIEISPHPLLTNSIQEIASSERARVTCVAS